MHKNGTAPCWMPIGEIKQGMYVLSKFKKQAWFGNVSVASFTKNSCCHRKGPSVATSLQSHLESWIGKPWSVDRLWWDLEWSSECKGQRQWVSLDLHYIYHWHTTALIHVGGTGLGRVPGFGVCYCCQVETVKTSYPSKCSFKNLCITSDFQGKW